MQKVITIWCIAFHIWQLSVNLQNNPNTNCIFKYDYFIKIWMCRNFCIWIHFSEHEEIAYLNMHAFFLYINELYSLQNKFNFAMHRLIFQKNCTTLEIEIGSCCIKKFSNIYFWWNSRNGIWMKMTLRLLLTYFLLCICQNAQVNV